MKYKKDSDNVYAYNVRMERIFISDAVSGRKGYLCMGCQKEMQAVISHLPNRISYFRHDHNAVKGLPKCTYSDETYRHKLAKQFLIALKRVKVPALYKYPPNDIGGIPMFLSESKFIEAEYVRPELFFYENEVGEVRWSRSISSEETKYLLLKPDIVFFDKDEKPILLIEIVATHKITEKKQLDLKRLGIDTIQITIPKDSPENIEKTFLTTERTKWIYNYEQEITEYISISNQYPEGILPTDEEQRKLLEESARCRKAQINNLIRTITRCLESEQFRSVTGELESQISRVENNTKEYRESFEQQRGRHQQNISDMRNEIRERINSKYRDRRNAVETASRDFENEEAEFRRHCVKENKIHESDLNNKNTGVQQSTIEKYRNRREAVENDKRGLEDRYTAKKNEIESITKSTEGTIRELTEQISTIEGNIEREREFCSRITTEKSRIEGEIREIRRREEAEPENLNRERERGKNLEIKFTNLRNELEERITKEGVELEERFDTINRQVREALKTRNFEGNEYLRRFKNLLADLDCVSDFIHAQEDNRRYTKAWECFTSAAYKHWVD